MITTENKILDSKGFVPRYLPWLLAAGMFIVYLVTLNHWVTPMGLGALGDVSGWNVPPKISGPLAYLITLPFKALPASSLPYALNLFAAVCAAITLGQLARSISLLPHDRTHEQREREHSEFSILTIKTAWIPPLFAVIVCGLQMTFWENSTQASFEMLDLLIFACVIRCLLEYRIDPRQSWLIRFCLLYGVGMAENWAMIGFLPLFFAALMWIKGISSLNPPFILKTLGFILIGFSLFLLMPALNGLNHVHPGFWESIHSSLSLYRRIFFSFPRITVGIIALTSILPLFVIGIRWASYFGDHSPLGIFLATSIFHIVHAVLLVACLWVALDSPISARQVGYGLPFLTFYYLTALSIGYFVGYFLLIFGTKLPKSQSPYYPFLRATNYLVSALLLVLLLGMPYVLIRKNLPHLKDSTKVAGIFQDYFTQVEKALPESGGIVLGDDPLRLLYLKSILERDGKISKFLLLDSHAFSQDIEYSHHLAKKFPAWKLPDSILRDEKGMPTIPSTILFLDQVARDHSLYYIDPSFGFFFEHFYLEPHGLVYAMKVYPESTWDAPLATHSVVEENRTYWQHTSETYFSAITNLAPRSDDHHHKDQWETFLTKIHLKLEQPSLVLAVGAYYSRNVNYWGVELQKLGQMTNAVKSFTEALTVNPYNVAAGVNRFFTANYLLGRQTTTPPKGVEELLGPHNGWVEVMNNDGPIDDPNFRDSLYALYAQSLNFRQAVQQLDRVKALAPADLRAPVQLAQLLIYIQNYTNALSQFLPLSKCLSDALTNTQYVLDRSSADPNALLLKGMALIQMKDYQSAIAPLSQLLLQTNNPVARLNRGIANLKSGNFRAAKPDYEAVLKDMPGTYQIYYGLGEIAYADKDYPAAIKNYELFMTNFPSKNLESDAIAARLKELKARVP